jgi:anti-sigma B factor antagonist
METSRPVFVKRVPESLSWKQARAFLNDVRPLLEQHDRPQVVFDFSLLRKLDSAGIDMLLDCMRQADRHDGELKLASLSLQAQVVLDLSRVGRLFEIFASSTDAVRSFSGYLPNMVRQFHSGTKGDGKHKGA